MSAPSKEQQFLAQLAAQVVSGLLQLPGRMTLGGSTTNERFAGLATEAVAIARAILVEVSK